MLITIICAYLFVGYIFCWRLCWLEDKEQSNLGWQIFFLGLPLNLLLWPMAFFVFDWEEKKEILALK